MNVMMCHCHQCKAQRDSFRGQHRIVRMKRSARRTVKRMLKMGEVDLLPVRVWVGYL
jgi:hypothetical protein